MRDQPQGQGLLLRWMRDLLAEPQLRALDVDADQRIDTHRQILRKKPALQDLFEELYRLCVDLDRRHLSGSGASVELGAGSSFFGDVFPNVIVTDITPAGHLDVVADALRLPFRDASVRVFYGIECFHHLPDPHLFFRDVLRTLVPGGGCVLIEPYHGLVARYLFRRLFDSESFEMDQAEWSTTTTGPMVGANQALSYIVFSRDREKFEVQYPSLRILCQRPLNNYIRYLGSGGLNFRALVPAALVPVAKLTERLLTPMNRLLALHHVIVLRKERDHPMASGGAR